MNAKSTSSSASLPPEDDAPELTEAWFAEADLYRQGRLVRRGRPPQAVKKIAVKLRLDPDIVQAFKASGPGWQTRINHALRGWLQSRSGDGDVSPAKE